MNEQMVPAGFEVTFLRWLRERTEQAWANYRTRPETLATPKPCA
jgi:hypothetical protein